VEWSVSIIVDNNSVELVLLNKHQGTRPV